MARLAGEAKSYAERLFLYPPVGPLDEAAASKAIKKPINDEKADISIAGIAKVYTLTQGYPFFLQKLASFSWNNAIGLKIAEADVIASYEETVRSLDKGFFRVRLDRLTKAELQFVNCMASLGDGPYQFSDVARSMHKEAKSLGPARASIIGKGMIYSTDHGYLEFTVPLFADFVRRQNAG